MARTETVIRLFLASPGDVSDERQKAAEVIEEVNRGIGRLSAIRIELVGWETATFPSFGVDAQDVINRQINDDYDILVGIMWARFGTKTSRYESGTEEEFSNAFSRVSNGGNIDDIMFYFKDEPVAPSKLDWDQIKKVSEFRKKIQESGIYTWEFNSVSDFEKAFRTHLNNKLVDFKVGRKNGSNSIEVLEPELAFDDRGLLELMQEIENESPAVTSVVEKISEHTSWISERINIHAEKIKDMVALATIPSSRAEIITIVNHSAEDLESYAQNIDPLSKEFEKLFGETYKKIADTLVISRNATEDTPENYDEHRDSIVSLREVLVDANRGLFDFSEAIRKTPPLTSKLNSAKRHVISSLSAISAQLDQAIRLFDEALG
jgi:archaellum component FlaC